MTNMQAISWCRKHNAYVRFESDGSVSVKVNDMKRRRATLIEAVQSLIDRLDDIGMAT